MSISDVCYRQKGFLFGSTPEPHFFGRLNDKTIFCHRCGKTLEKKTL